MAVSWSTDSYRHGYTIPLLFVYLLWQERTAARDVEWRPSGLGILFLVTSVAVWNIAVMTATQLVEQLAVVAMVSAVTFASCGWAVYRQFAFPMFFLLFMVPMGEELIPPLMKITADIGGTVVGWFGIPVYREGMYLQLPGGQFEVASACSGFRYLNAALVIGLIAGKMFFDRWSYRLAYVVLLLVAFILINGIRVVIVMIVASASDMTLLVGEDHILFGWFLFALALYAMLNIGDRLSNKLSGS